MKCARIILLKLWVPFKSCIFDIRNNPEQTQRRSLTVVSSFQILYLWHQKQHIKLLDCIDFSCEFLSNLVSLTSETTNTEWIFSWSTLWVPFKSCIFDIRNNGGRRKPNKDNVVSSFQILYLWHQKQLCYIDIQRRICCEFLSNLVSLTSETTGEDQELATLKLWVPFKSCIFDIRNNDWTQQETTMQVVSSFQILYLWHQKQPYRLSVSQVTRCEFLSNLVSLTSETTREARLKGMETLWVPFKSCIFDIRNNATGFNINQIALWVPFKSCIFDIRNNLTVFQCSSQYVVSSFQILYLWHQKQLSSIPKMYTMRCEFLSNLVSLTSETTK